MGQAVFSIDVAAIAVAGWVSLGAIGALADPGRSRLPIKSRTARRSPGAFAIALASLLIALVGIAPLLAEHELRAGQDAQIAFESFAEVDGHHSRAIAFHPFDPVYRGFRGAAHEIEARNYPEAVDRLPLFREALTDFREMDRLQPGYHRWLLTIGQSISKIASVGGAEFAEAQTWFERARSLAPFDWRVHQAKGVMLRLWGVTSDSPDRLCRALDEFQTALSIQPNIDTLNAMVATYERLGDLDNAEDLLAAARRRVPDNEQINAALESVRGKQEQPDRPPPHRCD
jgi:tetratricopeptide (TPR) repeat protein